MQARTLLAIVATLQLLTICLNFTLASYVIWLTLPFAALAFFGVFLAIYCGWRTGIWVFMGECRRGVGGQGSPGEIRRGGGAAGDVVPALPAQWRWGPTCVRAGARSPLTPQCTCAHRARLRHGHALRHSA